jgi:hypothetical protein
MTPPDSFDADLSALHSAVDSIGPWLAIWEARREPDARARRCASDAIGAADIAIGALHRIRSELVTQVRAADDLADARADELLAKTRDGPQQPVVTTAGSHRPTQHPPGAEVMQCQGTP